MLTFAFALLASSTHAATPTPAQIEFFEKNIRPVLAAECYECHSSAKKKAGLALDTRDGLLQGGDSGPAFVPGQPESSVLLQAIRHMHPTLKMPKVGAKLDARILANFAEWIRQGAPDPRTGPATASTEPASSTWADTLAFRRQWWSFQPLTKAAIPTPKNAQWSTNASDRFLLAKMESHGLPPGPDADPRTLIRRLTFALTGLPPKPVEVEAFVRECETARVRNSAFRIPHSALEKLTDRLLASPAFGERWARHWMDLMRYAETHGSEGDPEIPLAWRYRDYLIRAFNADVPADQLIREHAQGNYFFHTGFPFLGHPSAGAWMSYGLGTENENLPGFVVLQSGGAVAPHGGVGLFSSGYLPAQHQASIIKVDGDPALPNVKPRESDVAQRQRLNFIRALDEPFARTSVEAAVEAAIANYETAYRMQSAVPELCDISGESGATKRLYGLDSPHKQCASYGRQCLVARRLIERGVRFVELSCLNEGIGAGNAPNPWDQHSKVREGHGAMAHQVDQGIAALITDLKARGLFDDTLILFSGEFGRTPFSQGSDGRDHNPYGFSLWLAGGGIRGGTAYGATDELGYHAVEDKCEIYDLYATVLHLLGMNHEQLTYRFGGRDFRLTDVHGRVIREVLA